MKKIPPARTADATDTSKIAKIKVQENWDFKAIYSGISDPKIVADVVAIDRAYTAFAKKYGNERASAKYMNNAGHLKIALDDWNDLLTETGAWKPIWYLSMLKEIDSANTKVAALYTKYCDELIKSANQIIFFNLNLGKINANKQRLFLKDAKLAVYKSYLESIFEIAKYNLSEKEEKIINLKSGPAHSMWVDAQQKLFTKQMVKYTSKGKTKMIPITEAQTIKADLPIKERRALHAEIAAKQKEISFLAEAELNAVITNRRITDELRGFTKPYEATVLSYQNSIKSVEALVGSVTKRFSDANEFFKLKAKVLGLSKLTLAELGTKMSKSNKKFTLGEGIEMIRDSFGSANPTFADFFIKFLAEGRFDLFPKKGKRNGAFCSGGIGVPTYIMLNHIDDLNSVSTMAHEMGHAIHFEWSKKQLAIYEDTPVSIAEVASTFFENVLFDYIFERADAKEQEVMLLEKIQDDIFTIHSQISYFNFEIELHEQIKAKGQLSAAEIAALCMKHRKMFLGNAFELTEADGYFFVSVPHFRSFFYVYSYAYGQLIANALYAEYKKNPAFLAKIEQFLSAGSSKKPDDIFKDIGIDVTKPEFFEKGLNAIAERIKVAKKLIGK